MMHLVTRDSREPLRMELGGLVARALAWVQRLQAGRTERRGPRLRVMETLAIGGRKHLMLVSCGGERFLVGTGPDSVQTIVRVHGELEVPARPSVRGLDFIGVGETT